MVRCEERVFNILLGVLIPEITNVRYHSASPYIKEKTHHHEGSFFVYGCGFEVFRYRFDISFLAPLKGSKASEKSTH